MNQTIEQRVLAELDPHEGQTKHDLQGALGYPPLRQVEGALGRLRRKGLADCEQWHPGQVTGLGLEFVWFSVPLTKPNDPRRHQ